MTFEEKEEQRVLGYALRDIEGGVRVFKSLYNKYLDDCLEAEYEEKTCPVEGMYDKLYNFYVTGTIEYWLKRLEAQGASRETLSAIYHYEPSEWDGGCYTVIEDDKMIYER